MNDYKAGYVTLPIEKYHEILDEAKEVKRTMSKLFSVRKDWCDKVVIEANEEMAGEIAIRLFNTSEFAETHRLRDDAKTPYLRSTIADKIEPAIVAPTPVEIDDEEELNDRQVKEQFRDADVQISDDDEDEIQIVE